MAIAPFVFYLIAKGKWWLVAILSVLTWAFRGDNFIMAWQLIFYFGMIVGYYWDEINKKIAKDFGLDNMDSREQEGMVEKIGNLLFESVVERAIDVMDEEMMAEFENTVSEAGSDYQKVIGFLKSKVPGFNQIVSEELSRLKRATAGIFA
jgi:hypothetical protein